jgi:hypothetical protein
MTLNPQSAVSDCQFINEMIIVEKKMLSRLVKVPQKIE